MIGASIAAKGFGFCAQLALAWLLTRQQFGIFAIAVSLSVLLSVIRDGGLPAILVQRSRRFDEFGGPVFWLMLLINTLTALVIIACARPAAAVYHEPELTSVIVLFALNIPLCVPASVLTLRLSTELRFRQLGIIQFISAMQRNVLLLAFAWAGFGARSFILPQLIGNLTDAAMLYCVTRYAPWKQPPRWVLWRPLLSSGKWTVLGTFATAFGNNGAYFVLGRILESETVGVFFFAFQIVMQLGALLSDNLYRILFAAFVQIGRDSVRMRAAVQRSLQVVMFVGALVSLSIAAVFAPMQQLLWHGKWAAATGAVRILAAAWPLLAVSGVLRALQSAQGKFRDWALITLSTSVLSILGAAVGAVVDASATGAAAGFAIVQWVGVLVYAKIASGEAAVGSAAGVRVGWRPFAVVNCAALCTYFITGRFTSSALEFVASALCFLTLSLLGVRLLDREVFGLAVHSLRQALRRKPPGTVRNVQA